MMDPSCSESCALQICLDPGDGRPNRKIDRAGFLLQLHVDRTYLLAKTGKPQGRLNDAERSRLYVAGTIGKGSTNISKELAELHTAIQNTLPAHWSHRARSLVAAGALLATAVGIFGGPIISYFGAIAGAEVTAKATLEAAKIAGTSSIEVARIQADAQIAAAKIQSAAADKSGPSVALSLLPGHVATPTRAAIALAQLAQVDPTGTVSFAASDSVPWRFAVLDLAPLHGTIVWNGSKPIPAAVAKAAAKIGKAEASKQRRIAKNNGRPGIIAAPWVTEVSRTHTAPGSMRLGASNV